MSLLADLLSKVKRSEGAERDIPPELREIVAKGKRKGRTVKRLVLLGSLSMFLLASGFLFVHYLERNDNLAPPAPQAPPSPPAHTEAPVVAPAPSAEKEEAAPEETEAKAPAPRPLQTVPSPVPVPEPSGRPEEAQIQPATAERQAREASAGEVDAYIYTGRRHEEEGNYSLAVRQYLRALDLRPGDSSLMNAVAYCYLRLGMPDTALAYALEAVKASPGYVPAMVNAGIAYAETGNGPEAERYLRRALERDPFNRPAFFNLGLLYEKAGRLGESLEMFRGLVNTGDYDSSLHVGRVLERSGKADEAAAIYREILGSKLASGEARKEASRMLRNLAEPAPEGR
ncbi:MAG: hypothetical protein Kow0025_18260 [Thermodesulfovibrionales bacterium]